MEFNFVPAGPEQDRQSAELKAWVIAAVADGWSLKERYESESLDHSGELTHPDGWMAAYCDRPINAGRKYITLHVWGPDTLCIGLKSPKYSMDNLKKALFTCNYCDNEVTATERVGFGGRCCSICINETRKIVERPGWNL